MIPVLYINNTLFPPLPNHELQATVLSSAGLCYDLAQRPQQIEETTLKGLPEKQSYLHITVTTLNTKSPEQHLLIPPSSCSLTSHPCNWYMEAI